MKRFFKSVPVNSEQVGTIVRHACQFAFGVLSTYGLMKSDTGALVAAMLAAAAAAAWGVWTARPSAQIDNATKVDGVKLIVAKPEIANSKPLAANPKVVTPVQAQAELAPKP